jgi:arylsulfatase A
MEEPNVLNSIRVSMASVTIALCALAGARTASAAGKPNFIIIFTDDQGYNDLGCFGSKTIRTPNIDRMAAEGRRFTSFYVAANVCSPSRSALMTGCYPKRVGMERHVVFPKHNHGLHPDEVTIADMLKAAGYATACVGKWHLGHRKPFLPTSQGFDSYYGIPYSNDMAHPDNKREKGANGRAWANQDKTWRLWKTPLMQGTEIIELPVNQRTITRRYTDRAIEFVTANRRRPFFLYLPHSMPHIPLYVPKDVFDPDASRAYATVIEHIDAEVGRLVDTVRKLGLAEKTYIIFTSDNGPWLQFGNCGGSAKPLRAGKGTTFEGGHRVPCVMWAPGRIPAGTSTNAFITAMDILPSIAGITGIRLRARGPIDGKDMSAVVHGSDRSPRTEMLFYASRGGIEGLRQGDWKFRKGELFNLAEDIGESRNLAKKMPDKVAELKRRMTELDAEIQRNRRPRGELRR